MVIGVSGGLDSTHALIVAAKVCDRLGLPRTTILGFTMPGFATSEGTKANAWTLMNALGVTGEEIDIRPAAPADARRHRPPVRRGRAGLRRHLRERAGGAAHRLPVPARQPAQRLRARHRRPVGAGARLVHLRRRRPDEPLRRQRRRAEDADPVPDPLGVALGPVRRRRPTRCSRRSSAPRSRPSWCRPTPTARSSRPRRRSAPTSCTTSSSTTSSATASGRRRSPSSPGTPGTTRDAGLWPIDFPEAARRAYDLPTIRKWLEIFLWRFFDFSQFKRSALPNGPKVSAGGALSPRGDWRAPRTRRRAPWLDELRRSLPTR